MDQCLPLPLGSEALEQWADEARRARMRRWVVIHGDHARGDALCRVWHASHGGVWLGPEGMSDAAALRCAGQSIPHVICDARAGLNPDVWCLLSGSVAAGGLVIWRLPSLQRWAHLPDPDYARMRPWGLECRPGPARFIARLARQLTEDADVAHIDVDADRVVHPRPFVPQAALADDALAIQLRGTRPVTVLMGGRGRGKSTALGLHARWLREQEGVSIVLVSSHESSVQTLLAAAGEIGGQPVVRWLPADQCLAQPTPADVLLVDEAAMLPVAVLDALVARHARAVLATTAEGYEGSGQGFVLKWLPRVRERCPDLRVIEAVTPHRWASGDPVERGFCRAFGLPDAAAAGIFAAEVAKAMCASEAAAGADEALHLAWLDPDDEESRVMAHALLRSAHYRTRPSELRDLLDGPNIEVCTVRQGTRVLGACSVAREGPLADVTLQAEILGGRRRPRGHLLPQMLAFHAQLPECLSWSSLRIIRIAVSPALRRRGWATRLIRSVELRAREQGDALVGSSFASAPEVEAFWKACGYVPVWRGAGAGTASGQPSVLMLQAVHDVLRPTVLALALEAEQDRQALCPGADDLSRYWSERARARLERFASGALPFGSAKPVLIRWWHGLQPDQRTHLPGLAAHVAAHQTGREIVPPRAAVQACREEIARYLRRGH